jgi:hypothetical protein
MKRLAELQREMKAKMPKRPGRPTKAQAARRDDRMMLSLRRWTCHQLLEAGLPYGLVADEVNRAFDGKLTAEQIEAWDKKGRPLARQ